MCRSIVFLCIAIVVSGESRAQDAVAALEKAKKTHKEAIEKTQAGLLDAFEAALKAAMASGNLDAVKAIQAEKAAYEDDGKLPISTRMQSAVAAHRVAMKQAHAAIELAFEKAIKELTKGGKIAEAEAVQVELKALRLDTGGLRAADVATKETLQQYLAGSSWVWGEEAIRLKPNGYVENKGWDDRGLVIRWHAVDRRTVVLIIEKGRDVDRCAVFTYSEDLAHYSGFGFEGGSKLPVSKRIQK